MDSIILLWILCLILTVTVDAGCPSVGGWTQLNDFCYADVITSERNWEIARAHCQSFGGDLLVLDSEEDIMFINATLDISTVWVGCHDRLTAGEWLCSRQIMGSLVNWAEGQPSMQGCVYIDSNWELHVDSCDVNKKYICEAQLGQATTNSFANCPVEWEEWNGGCYYYSYQQMSWDLADGYCRDAVSSLVTFKTASERDNVRDLFPGQDVWIGCNNRESINDWSCHETQDPFLDFGTSVSSTDIADQCLVMSESGSFRYEACSSATYSFVCRMPVGQYQGCFPDQSVRTLAVGPFHGSMNLHNCMVQCNAQNYVFAGLQAAVQCFCGNTGYLRLGRAPDWECTRECPGQSGQYCGSGWRNTVYKVGSRADVVERKYSTTKNKRLNAGIYEERSTWSITACIDACTRRTQCISFNFCKTGSTSGICQLSHDRKAYLTHMWEDSMDCEYGEVITN